MNAIPATLAQQAEQLSESVTRAQGHEREAA